MNTKELIYIKTIAEEKSISRAAKRLYIAQPSLSQSVQRVEDSLGVKLFNRTTNGLTLTYAGERYYQMANQILRMYDNFKSEVTDINNLTRGEVNFGVTNYFGNLVLPRVLPAFHEEHPLIDIHITQEAAVDLQRKLLSCELDFILIPRISMDEPSQFAVDLIGDSSFVLVTSERSPLPERAVHDPSYPYPLIDLKDLGDEPLVTVGRYQPIRQIVDSAFKQAGIAPKIAIESKYYSSAQLLAANGFGYTIGPLHRSDLTRLIDMHPVFLSIDKSYAAKWYYCILTNQMSVTTLSRADLELIRRIKDCYTYLF